MAARKPRTDLLEEDPFANFGGRRVQHAQARDDGQWRQQPHVRVVQVQFNPFMRGFQEQIGRAPKMHTGSFWHFSKTELKDLGISLLCFSLALAFVFQGGLFGGMLNKMVTSFLAETVLLTGVAVIAFGPAFIIHELAHKFVARHYNCWAEFRADPRGLRNGVILAAIIGFLFMAPGAVMVAGNVSRRQNGMIALAGPVSNLILWLLMLPVALFVPLPGMIEMLVMLWFSANAILGMFNMLPIGPLDGRKIKSWNQGVFWLFIAIFVALVYVTMFNRALIGL